MVRVVSVEKPGKPEPDSVSEVPEVALASDEVIVAPGTE
jgi:hypothetical protein